MSVFHHKVTKEQANTRLDKLLTDINPEHSRSEVQAWIANGLVRLNRRMVKANYKCQTDDVIEWEIRGVKPMEILPDNIALSISDEDSDLLVVNKEKGLVVLRSAGRDE